MTSHPNDLTQKLVETMNRHPKICKHIHLPIQSGSDKVLHLMKRGYTTSDYLEKVRLLRSAMPGISITSDIIAGFPGETEKEFQETIWMLKEVQFDALFAFKYSDRPNTIAPSMDGHVSEEIKSERLGRILELQQQISRDKNQKLIGTVQEVLVEGVSKNNPERWAGRTDCNRMIHFNTPRDLKGRIVPLRITEARVSSLDGELV